MFEELEEEQSQFKSADYYWSILRRRRWWLILLTFGVWAAVEGGSWLLPSAYKSETLILVEQQKVPEHYVVPNVTSDLQDRLQSMTQQILSRTRLMRIIDQFQLYTNLKSRLTLDEMVDKMRKDIGIDLVRAPGSSGVKNDLTAFRISYSSTSPRVAQQIAGQLTSLFIEENLKDRTQQSEDTTSFLTAQLDDARKSLSEQEERIREFKAKYLGALPTELASNLNILTGLQGRLQQEMQAINQTQQQVLYLQTLVDQYRSIQLGAKNGSTDPAVPPVLDQELTKLKAQLAKVQTQYTERHPDYRSLKEQIAKAEKMKQEMAEDLQSAAPTKKSEEPVPAGNNGDKDSKTVHPTTMAEMREMSPMLQLEGQLKSAQMEMQNRQKLASQLEAQIETYQARLKEAPIREQQLFDLTRDYDMTRANYDSLLAKRNQSEMATSLEKRQQGEQFRIIDPPSFPFKPYKPDRMLFGLGGLLAGIFISIAVVAMSELSDGRIFHESDFKNIVSAPVLAEIPPLPTPLETLQRSRQRRLEWAGALIMLLVMVGGFAFTVLRG